MLFIRYLALTIFFFILQIEIDEEEIERQQQQQQQQPWNDQVCLLYIFARLLSCFIGVYNCLYIIQLVSLRK